MGAESHLHPQKRPTLGGGGAGRRGSHLPPPHTHIPGAVSPSLGGKLRAIRHTVGGPGRARFRSDTLRIGSRAPVNPLLRSVCIPCVSTTCALVCNRLGGGGSYNHRSISKPSAQRSQSAWGMRNIKTVGQFRTRLGTSTIKALVPQDCCLPRRGYQTKYTACHTPPYSSYRPHIISDTAHTSCLKAHLHNAYCLLHSSFSRRRRSMWTR